jgi:tripartite-type tricarboxylate transporter receptor subunit TctC
MTSRRTATLALLSTAFCTIPGLNIPAMAQGVAWPTKPVRLIVPYPAGGVTDAVSRLLAERLALALGQPFVVDNRAGAGGVTGMDAVAKATDGHMLALAAISPLTLLPHVMHVPYDPLKDFAPVATVMYSPVYLLATPAFTGKTFDDMLVQAKANPGKLSMATSGVGTVGNIMLEQIKRKAGVDIIHVPYKGGGGQIIGDAAGGHFDLFTTNPSANVDGLIAKGKLRILAVTGPTRLPGLPDVSTLAELGHPLANLTSLFGLFAPAKTPPEVLQRLNAEVNKILAQKEVQEKLTKLDNVVTTGTMAQFAATIKSESAANAKVVKDANIRME